MTQQDHTMQRDCRHFLLLLNSPKPCDKFAIISKRTFRWLRLRTSFARLREVNLLGCLSGGLDRLVHCLETEASAQYLTAPGTQPPPYGSQQVLSPFLPTANVARNDSDSCAVGRATAQKKPWRTTTPWATTCNQSVTQLRDQCWNARFIMRFRDVNHHK